MHMPAIHSMLAHLRPPATATAGPHSAQLALSGEALAKHPRGLIGDIRPRRPGYLAHRRSHRLGRRSQLSPALAAATRGLGDRAQTLGTFLGWRRLRFGTIAIHQPVDW